MTIQSLLRKPKGLLALALLAFALAPTTVWGDRPSAPYDHPYSFEEWLSTTRFNPPPTISFLVVDGGGCSDCEFYAGLAIIATLFLVAVPYKASRRIRLLLTGEATLIFILIAIRHYDLVQNVYGKPILAAIGAIEIAHILVSVVYQIAKKSLLRNWKQDVCRILLLVAIALSVLGDSKSVTIGKRKGINGMRGEDPIMDSGEKEMRARELYEEYRRNWRPSENLRYWHRRMEFEHIHDEVR